MDLADLMSDWLAGEHCLEKGTSIIMTKAFRLGSKLMKQNDGPRDIIITLLNQRWKQRILYKARQKKFLNSNVPKSISFQIFLRKSYNAVF